MSVFVYVPEPVGMMSTLMFFVSKDTEELKRISDQIVCDVRTLDGNEPWLFPLLEAYPKLKTLIGENQHFIMMSGEVVLSKECANKNNNGNPHELIPYEAFLEIQKYLCGEYLSESDLDSMRNVFLENTEGINVHEKLMDVKDIAECVNGNI